MSTDLTNYTGPDGGKPWLCVHNYVTDATIDATSADAGYEAEAVRGPQTYSAWSPSVLPARVRAVFEASSEHSVNYFALYVADGGNCTFTPQRWNGATWVALGAAQTVPIGEPAVLLWIFDAVSAGEVGCYVEGGSEAVYVATMKCGVADVMPYCPDVGFAPSRLNPDESYQAVMSHGGQVLGSFLERSESSQPIAFGNLTPSWVRDNWPAIRAAFRTEGVFLAWRPDDYPDEVVYGMVEGRPSVSYATHSRMALTFNLRGPKT